MWYNISRHIKRLGKPESELSFNTSAGEPSEVIAPPAFVLDDDYFMEGTMPLSTLIEGSGYLFRATNMSGGLIMPDFRDPKTACAVLNKDPVFWETFRGIIEDWHTYQEWMMFCEITSYPDHYTYEYVRERFDDNRLVSKAMLLSYLGDVEKYREQKKLEKVSGKKKIKPGWIYVLKSERGEYKIGLTTRTPNKRLEQISPALPYRVELLFAIKSDDPCADEAILHDMFSGKRLNGEWFDLSESDLSIIRNKKWQ